jgi:2-oxoacid:acceptor oxidoreductase gamma subunit (pyruvate/2-ketoisovalerate family)
MVEMTLYGRGGQGGVTLAKLIATAYFLRGRYAQAFGVYAAERSGAPIQAYVRIDDEEIANHNQIREPDHVIVLDPTLISNTILSGLDPEGWIILNTTEPAPAWADVFPGRRVAVLDATGIAVEHGLGTRTVPIVNTTMMGAIARVFGLSVEEVEMTFAELKFGGRNFAAATEAYDRVQMQRMPGNASKVFASAPPTHIAGILDPDLGAPPRILTGSWATRRPSRRTLTPPCNHTCPAGNDVQAFVDAVGREAYTEALEVLLETSPFPGVCGRVCPAPCMEVCNRNAFDEGVNVREIERYAADHGSWPMPGGTWRSDRVAVIGSGPAGLSATYHLAKLGYHVTLFEANDELGGVLRNGIPEYRLPREVLDREIGFILMHGVSVHTNSFVDRTTLLRLSQQYSAVFVGTGLQESRAMKLGAVEPDTVVQGLDFLDRVSRHDVSIEGQRVVVVGGGNTAIDAARSSLRLGARNVRILYRRSRVEMPAIAEEIDAALEEGVVLTELVLPTRIDGAELTVMRMKLGDPDASGRRQPIPDESPDAQFAIACDKVILALGQSADVSILAEGSEIRENGQLLGLACAPVYIGGDFGSNEGTVTAAIGSGRRAAWHIHRALTGEDLFPPEAPAVATREDLHLNLFAHGERQRGGAVPIEIRRRSFLEVHTGLGEREGRAAAVLEAQRCFSCGVCNECDRCLTYCPEGILTRDGEGYRFNYDYCKGCGLCSSECPRGVVIMSEL